jgi:hypothetical protein
MGHQFEVHLAHVKVIALDALHSLMVDVQHLSDLLLGQTSFTFNQRTDGVNLCGVTRTPGPRQISKLDAPVIKGRRPLLDGLQCDHILAITFSES